MRRTAALLLLLPLLVTACATSDDSGAESTAQTTSAATATATPSPKDPAYVVARVSTGHKPCGILGVEGRVWVSNYGDDDLVSVDPATGDVSAPAPTGSAPCGLAYGAGSMWVEDFGGDQVTRVSAADGTVQATYDVGDQPYDVTFAAGAAWVTNYGDGTVSRIDAKTGKVTDVETGGTPIGIAPAGGKVWVGLGSDGIAAIDTDSAEVTATIDGDPAGWTAYDDSHVWVNVGETVVQIDPATATVTRTIEVGSRPEDGTVAAGRVWVGDGGGDLYWFPVDGDDTRARSAPSSVQNPFVAAELDGQLWLVDFAGTDVVRVDPDAVG